MKLNHLIFPTAVFELAIIRMSRFYDVSQKAVLFLDSGMLPMEVFMTTGDTTEMELVSQIFDFAKSLAEMQLSEASEVEEAFDTGFCPSLQRRKEGS